jgi:hypothetical protein
MFAGKTWSSLPKNFDLKNWMSRPMEINWSWKYKPQWIIWWKWSKWSDAKVKSAKINSLWFWKIDDMYISSHILEILRVCIGPRIVYQVYVRIWMLHNHITVLNTLPQSFELLNRVSNICTFEINPPWLDFGLISDWWSAILCRSKFDSQHIFVDPVYVGLLMFVC